MFLSKPEHTDGSPSSELKLCTKANLSNAFAVPGTGRFNNLLRAIDQACEKDSTNCSRRDPTPGA